MIDDDEWTDESFYDDNETYQKQRRTLPEALDAARDGKEFAQVLQGLFGALEKAMNGGDCPRCNSYDDDLSARGGICESCYLEENQ